MAGMLLIGLAQPPIQILHPVRDFIFTNQAGADIVIQLRIARHKDNRSYRIEWFGDGCGGLTERQLDGQYAAATQLPIQIRVYAGTCEFRVLVFASGRKVRLRKGFKLEIVGS